jgi:hypothetical protein
MLGHRNPETHPLDISEEEAIAMALANSELDQLAMWDGIVVQLRESSLAQRRPVNPPATPTRTHARPFSCFIPGLGSVVAVTAGSHLPSIVGLPTAMVNAGGHRTD